MAIDRDHSLDTLLDLDGQTFFVDPSGQDYRVKFEVRKVTPSSAKPHGLDYSLTLHGPRGERLVGFDNAHGVTQGSGPGAKRPAAYDHRHRLRTVQPYEYRDAATLIADFWAVVDAVLKEQGVLK